MWNLLSDYFGGEYHSPECMYPVFSVRAHMQMCVCVKNTSVSLLYIHTTSVLGPTSNICPPKAAGGHLGTQDRRAGTGLQKTERVTY